MIVRNCDPPNMAPNLALTSNNSFSWCVKYLDGPVGRFPRYSCVDIKHTYAIYLLHLMQQRYTIYIHILIKLRGQTSHNKT